MATDVKFSRDTVLELNRMMYKLYKFFSLEASALNPASDIPFTTGDQIHLDSKPSDFYSLEIGSVRVSIHEFRSHYCLELLGCTTSFVKPRPNFSEHPEKYRNFYGDFVSFEECKNAFYHVCVEQLNQLLGALF